MTTGPSSKREEDLTDRVLDGRYRVDRMLGRGGMGSVYLAFDERMRRNVVVKVPHSRFLDEEGFRERFELEIQSLTRLSHPQIVKALDTGVIARDGGRAPVPFAVLEYLAGGSLRDRLNAKGGRQAPAEVATWLAPVAQALDFIHARKFVHRDVKPGNVLFDESGHAFLADFGIAKALGSADTGLTATGMTPGSPDYMAPEGGLGTEVGPTYDQYALAVVVYEALSGRLPHRGPTPVAILVQRHMEPVPALATVAPNVPAAVASVVMRALERDPARRYSSCSSFAKQFVAMVEEASRGGAGLGPAALRTIDPVVTRPAAPPSPARDAERRPPARARVEEATRGAPRFAEPAYPAAPPRVAPVRPASPRPPSPRPPPPADVPRTWVGAPSSPESASSGGRRIWPYVVVGGLLALGGGGFALHEAGLLPPAVSEFVSRLVGPRPTTAPSQATPDSAGLFVDVTSPKSGDVVGSRDVRVTGRASIGPDVVVRVNGRIVERSGAEFETSLRADADGALAVRVVVEAPAARHVLAPFDVVIDTTPPVLVLSSPTAAATVLGYADPDATVAGRATDLHLAAIRLDGASIPRGEDGAFEATVAVAPGAERTVEFDALDAAGLASEKVRRTFRRAPPPPPYAASLEHAVAAAARDDFDAAMAAWTLALSKGATPSVAPAGFVARLDAYVADPVLELARPVEGVVVKEAEVTVEGELVRGRASDEVIVGDLVARTGVGPFRVTVTLPAPGPFTLAVEVRDRGRARGRAVARTGRYEVPVWPAAVTKFLGAWARPEGSAEDPKSKFPLRIRRTKDAAVMAFIPDGAFLYGAVPGDARADDDEKPRLPIAVSKFYLDVTEVTIGQWRLFPIGQGGGMPSSLLPEATERHPIHNVMHGDATAYAKWVGGELPTEAQWERAARGGHDDFVYPWGVHDDVARRNGLEPSDGFPGLAPVASFPANDFGLFDMAGNVREWCADFYAREYYKSGPKSDPTGPLAGTSRALRGGSSKSQSPALRASARGGYSPRTRLDVGGFRVAKRIE